MEWGKGWVVYSTGVVVAVPMSHGRFAIILVLVLVFVRPRWWVELSNRVGCGAVVVVAIVSVVGCAGRWWGIGCHIAVFTRVWLFWFRWLVQM